MIPLDKKQIFAPPHRTRIIGREGEVHRSLPSTMDAAREKARDGAPDGYVVLAERQSAGRGRDGPWECPPAKGLLMTVVLRLGLRRTESKLISFLGPVAAAEALQEFGCRARIKWPNDIVVADHGPDLSLRKLGGVLVEQVSRGDTAPIHLLGIGINVNQTPEELPADTKLPPTSLAAERPDGTVDRARVCRGLLEKLDEHYRKLHRGRTEELPARWRALSCLIDKRIRARVDGRTLTGRVTGLRATGEILLRLPGGRQKALSPERTTILVGAAEED